MTLKQKDVERLFIGKLKAFRKADRAKHIAFEYIDESNRMPLPPLTMSRGSGDVGMQVCRGLSSTLGVSRDGFESGARCRVGAGCFWLCLAAKLLHDRCSEHRRDPNVYNNDWMTAAAKTAESLLARAKVERGAGAWNTLELKELRGAKAKVTEAAGVLQLKDASFSWFCIAGPIDESTV